MILHDAVLADLNPWWRGAPIAGIRPIRRPLQARLLAQLVRRDDRRAAVLLGPRQVGKTTLLKQSVADLIGGPRAKDTAGASCPAGNVIYCDFSDERFVAGPPTPREIAAVQPPGFDPARPKFLLFDEIGRAEHWAEWLKQAVDTEAGRILVTDSSATLLRHGSHESGMGRWDEHVLEGLTFAEFLLLQGRPDEALLQVARRLPDPLNRYLARGGFPEHMMSEHPDEVRARLRTDITSRAIARDLSRYGVDARIQPLFAYLMEMSGAVFTPSARAAELQEPNVPAPDHRTISRWLDLLETTMLLKPLWPRTTRPVQRLTSRSRPKMYAGDHGLVVAFARTSQPLADADTRGRIVETAVFRALRSCLGRGAIDALSYFQFSVGSRQLEVDFVIEGPSGPVALEVTSSAHGAKKIETIRAAAEALRTSRCMVVHGGLDRGVYSGVLMVPLQDFLIDPEAALAACT